MSHQQPNHKNKTGVFHLLKRWPLWIIVGLMMLAMIAYVMTLDESEAPVAPGYFPEELPAETP